MTNFSAISNFIGDCFQYFRDVSEFNLGDDDEVVYRLLCLAQDICDKNVEK